VRVPDRLVLVGFMGSGKSTVGPLLAAELGWGFRDLDGWIEAREGQAVADLFRERGEPAFRALERAAAGEAASLREHVVATGGGAFAQEDTRELLRQGACTVWLRCGLDAIWARVGGDARRPLAANRATMAAILQAREPFYGLADLVVDTTHTQPGDVVQRIVEGAGLKSRAAGSSGR
jgi:shikimate kinase